MHLKMSFCKMGAFLLRIQRVDTGGCTIRIWRHHDVETLSASLALCEENLQSLVVSLHKGPMPVAASGFTSQMASNTVELWCFVGNHVNTLKLLNYMLSLQWFEAPWHSFFSVPPKDAGAKLKDLLLGELRKLCSTIEDQSMEVD